MAKRDDFEARLAAMDPGALLVEHGTPGALHVVLERLAEAREALLLAARAMDFFTKIYTRMEFVAPEDWGITTDGVTAAGALAKKFREIAGEKP